MYSKKTIKHFRNPHNLGEIKKADAKGEAGNIVCGDVMSLYIKVKKNKKGEEVITDIKFKTYGCAAAIATSSAVTDLVKGKTIEEAIKVSKNDIVDFLDGLPPIKVHCSILAIEALGEAIYQYLQSKKRKIPKELEERHRHVELTKKNLDDRYRLWKSMAVAKSS